ncbi:hypothetical protein DPMN_178225 [Dreissena polymorpha]|uniref:Uncharacterized protein n=1 Tax=Dreissena polymorpha TaxID=45954 RepID=A0A9D4EES6_DREPO|nr:hypothetical protein DPMN_178225 [Dreissena polymorpha]
MQTNKPTNRQGKNNTGGHKKMTMLTHKTDFKNKKITPPTLENASYIHIEKTAPPPGGNVFPLITTIFKLIQYINETDFLTKFHDDWPKNVTFEYELNRKNLLTKCHEDWAKNKTAPPPGGHVFFTDHDYFKLNQDIHKTNVLTKFHDDWTKNVTSRVKKTPPPVGHKRNVLTKFHKDWVKNVSSRLFTCFHYIHIEKTAPSPGSNVCPLIMTIFKIAKNVTSRVKKTPLPGGHVFLPIRTIFELNCHIQETNVRTKFHEDWAKNVSSRLFTCLHYIHIEKTAPHPGSHVFSLIMTIIELVRDICKIDAKNVTSRETNVLTKFQEDLTKNVTSRVFTCFHYIHIEKTALPPGGHFHDDWAKIVTSRVNIAQPPGGHVFQWTQTVFELNQHIIKTNILTKLHEDWASNVTSTVFTSFELGRGIIGTNVLTKFHEDRTINANVDAARRTKGDHKSSP